MKYRIEIIRDDGRYVRPLKPALADTQRHIETLARLGSINYPGIYEVWGIDDSSECLLSRAIDGNLSRA